MPHYLHTVQVGLDHVASLGDGYTISVRWYQAYPDVPTNKVGYNIYYSKTKEDVFYEGIKYISIDDSLEVNIINLEPGQNYFFSVRPFEFNPLGTLPSILPIVYDNLRILPTGTLRSDITYSQLTIPLIDVSLFPTDGYVQIGAELIQYSSVDSVNKNLILNNISQRGVGTSVARTHTTDGYDGLYYFNPTVSYYVGKELFTADRIYLCQSRFEYPHYQSTVQDGYHQVLKDYLSIDLSASDSFNVGFPTYDYAGYHRTDPVQLLNGTCVGSYIGGESYCIDGYGVGTVLRGLSLQDQNNQRQELLLSVTGKPATLIKMVNTGITCSCYQPSSEYPDDRCPLCFGKKFVISYEQYFNPRRSDGRILVRISPADENLKMTEAGLESEFQIDGWTLTVPTLKSRDIIILFSQDNNEEFRYEITSVNRNNTIEGLQGAQKFKAQRIRKTDIAYQINAFRDTSTMPSKLTTGIGMTTGILPHTHTITRNEKDPSTWKQLTSVSAGHNHPVSIKNGLPVVDEVLSHTHTIIL